MFDFSNAHGRLDDIESAIRDILASTNISSVNHPEERARLQDFFSKTLQSKLRRDAGRAAYEASQATG